MNFANIQKYLSICTFCPKFILRHSKEWVVGWLSEVKYDLKAEQGNFRLCQNKYPDQTT